MSCTHHVNALIPARRWIAILVAAFLLPTAVFAQSPAPTPPTVTAGKLADGQTAPVIDFYRQHGVLKAVDGEGSMDEVFTRIVEAISVGIDVG